MKRRTALAHIAAASSLPLLPRSVSAARAPEFPPPVRGEPPFILKRYLNTRRAWAIDTQLQVLPLGRISNRQAPGITRGNSPRLEIDKLVLTAPIAPTTGLSHPDQRYSVKGEMTSEGRPYAPAPRVSDPYALGTRLAIFNAGPTRSTNIRMRMTNHIVSYDCDIDDARALRVPWPESFKVQADDLTPAEAALNAAIETALEPQTFIDSENEFITELLERWTSGQPKKLTPYALVKYLASRVFLQCKPDNKRFLSVIPNQESANPIAVEGLRVLGAEYAAQQPECSPYDFVNLLVALYRAAGIPTRLIIGIDVQTQDDSAADSYEGDLGRIHAWAEIYLVQPGQRVGQWIPFDALRLRRRSERTPPLDRKWDFLGYLRNGRFYAPLTCHWHPPTVVVSPGPPSLWGWIPDTPSGELPAIEQRLIVRANPTEQRGSAPDVPTPPLP